MAASGICGDISSVSCGSCDIYEYVGCDSTYVGCAASVCCDTSSGCAITVTLDSDKLL